MTTTVKIVKRRAEKIRGARFDFLHGIRTLHINPIYLPSHKFSFLLYFLDHLFSVCLIVHVHRPALFIRGWLVLPDRHLLRHVHPKLY